MYQKYPKIKYIKKVDQKDNRIIIVITVNVLINVTENDINDK